MNDPILMSFLKRQLVEATALNQASDLLELCPCTHDGAGLPSQALSSDRVEFTDPPDRYIAEFHCKGLIQPKQGEIAEYDRWAVGIWFPADYLRSKTHVAEVLTYLGPNPQPFHPNIRAPFICMDLQVGMPLVEIIYGLYDLITWNLFSTADEGLNHEASQWARKQHPSRFPIDKRPLKRRKLALAIETANPASTQ